eukprot:31440-Pelagococcus_subviridis.AAC.32
MNCAARGGVRTTGSGEFGLGVRLGGSERARASGVDARGGRGDARIRASAFGSIRARRDATARDAATRAPFARRGRSTA